jgi:hypothetical protein
VGELKHEETEGNRFKLISPPEAQSFRLQDQPKAAEAALSHENPTSEAGLKPLSEAFSDLIAGSFELPAARKRTSDFEAIALTKRRRANASKRK